MVGAVARDVGVGAVTRDVGHRRVRTDVGQILKLNLVGITSAITNKSSYLSREKHGSKDEITQGGETRNTRPHAATKNHAAAATTNAPRADRRHAESSAPRSNPPTTLQPSVAHVL